MYISSHKIIYLDIYLFTRRLFIYGEAVPQVLDVNSLEFSSRSVVSMCNTGKHLNSLALTRGQCTSFSAPVFVVSLRQRTFLHPVLLKEEFLSVSSMFT